MASRLHVAPPPPNTRPLPIPLGLMPHSSRETIPCHSHCCQVIEGGLARTDPPSPRASLPTGAKQSIWDGRDSKVSRTARPGQTGPETFKPPPPRPRGEDGRPRRPRVVYLLSPHPFSHHRLSGLHGNPAGSASPGEVGLTGTLPPPSLLAAMRLPGPSLGGRGCPSPSVQPHPRPQRAAVQVGTSEGHGPRRSKLWAQRGRFLEKGG